MKQLKSFINQRQGFTLIEIVVSTSIVVLVLVAVTSGVTVAIRNSRYSQEKALSVRYAQEAIEWVRTQRDMEGWRDFNSRLDTLQSSTFGEGSTPRFELCLNHLDLTQLFDESGNYVSPIQPGTQNRPDTQGGQYPNQADVCREELFNDKYAREITLDRVSDDQINITSTVTWMDRGEWEETQLETSLYRWK